MLKVRERIEGLAAHKIDCDRAHEPCADTKTCDDDGERGRKREGTNHTVEREGGIEHVEIDKQHRAGTRHRAGLDIERVNN